MDAHEKDGGGNENSQPPVKKALEKFFSEAELF